MLCRQSPRVDPLYLAPLSPRRSNPATPRSSPARSPAPIVPLSAAALGLGLMRSPIGTAPMAALAAGRTGMGSRQGQALSAGSKGLQERSGPHQRQQSGAAGARRSASAPATPVAVAAQGAPAEGPGYSAATGRSSAGRSSSSSGSSYGGRSRSGVSHESLYCQRLAYSSQRSTVAPGVRKTDRVARFQQMSEQWQRDRYAQACC